MPVHNVSDFDYFLIDNNNNFQSFKTIEEFYEFTDKTGHIVNTLTVINFDYSECLKNTLYITNFKNDFFTEYRYTENINKIEYRLDLSSNIIIPYDKYQNLKKITIFSSRLSSLKYFEGFKSLECLTLHHSKIRKLDGFFPNLKKINLSNNKFELDDSFIDIFPNLTDIVLRECFLTKIPESFSKLSQLTVLNLGNNKLSSLPDSLSNTIEHLNLENNVFTVIPKCIHSLIHLRELDLSDNAIQNITDLMNLKDLRKLYMTNNIIESIAGIEQLIHLEILILDENKIKDVTGIGKLINLKKLVLHSNLIENIDDLVSLTQLKNLHVGHNFIKDVTITKDLVNLEQLNIIDNLVEKLPIYNKLTKLEFIQYHDNLFEKLDKINELILSKLNNVYNDKENVHTTKIQDSVKDSIINLLNDDYSITKEELLKELNEEKIDRFDDIKLFIDDSETYSSDEHTYFSIFMKVWGRIQKSEFKNDLIQRLNEEIDESIHICFVGRLSRLINVLHGFFDDIHINISDNDQISNVIISIQKKYSNQDYDLIQDQMKEEIIRELKARDYSDEIIKEWVENTL